MTRRRASNAARTPTEPEDNEDDLQASGEDDAPDNDLLCRLTGERFKRTPEEEALQDLIDQLHREYRFDLGDMARDVSLSYSEWDYGKEKYRNFKRKAAVVVYAPGGPRELHSTCDCQPH